MSIDFAAELLKALHRMKKQFSSEMVPRKQPGGNAPSVTNKEQQKVGSPVPDEEHLEYGEGQREEYGEGEDYRPEDKSKSADQAGKNQSFGADSGNREKGVSSRTSPNGKR